MSRYQKLDQLIELIDEPAQSSCQQIMRDHGKLFKTVQGSTHNHQAWPGGYADHVTEVMNIAAMLYGAYAMCRPLPFNLSDALLVLFLHDIEKPWKYFLNEQGELEIRPDLVDKEAQHAFRAARLEEYGIVLTDEQTNAMRYVEGEGADYSSKRRVMNSLAGFCHVCDVTSARIWFNHPLESGDTWAESGRDRT